MRRVGWFVIVCAVWLAGLVTYASTGREPYPALFQPPFYVPRASDYTSSTQTRYLVEVTGGRRELIDGREVFAPAGGKEAYFALYRLRGVDTTDPETLAWLRQKVAPLVDGQPVELKVVWVSLRRYDDGRQLRVRSAVHVFDLERS